MNNQFRLIILPSIVIRKEKRSIVFYDGQCGFCNDTVQRILRRDKNKLFHFCSLQSHFASNFMQAHAIDISTLNTLYVYHEGEIFNRSLAVATIGKHLQGLPYKGIAWLIKVFPVRAWLDSVYDLIANNRHHLPAKKQQCILLSEQDRKRFIDY